MAKKSSVVTLKEEPPVENIPLELSRSGMRNSSVSNPKFTGIARSVECYNNQGHNNYRILTLYITDGQVTKMDISDPYANFEAMTRLNHWNELSILHINNQWKNGKTWLK